MAVFYVVCLLIISLKLASTSYTISVSLDLRLQFVRLKYN